MSIVPEISTKLVFDLYNSEQQFPVSFDAAWQWLGFTRKDQGKRSLLNCGFAEGIDLRFKAESMESQFGTPEEKIQLTVDCFKTWAMMANTQKGKEVRLYFLDCEKQLKQLIDMTKVLPKVQQERLEKVNKLYIDVDKLCLKDYNLQVKLIKSGELSEVPKELLLQALEASHAHSECCTKIMQDAVEVMSDYIKNRESDYLEIARSFRDKLQERQNQLVTATKPFYQA